MAVCLSGYVIWHISEVLLCRARLLLSWLTSLGYNVFNLVTQAVLSSLAWVGKMSTSDAVKKPWVLHNNRFC